MTDYEFGTPPEEFFAAPGEFFPPSDEISFPGEEVIPPAQEHHFPEEYPRRGTAASAAKEPVSKGVTVIIAAMLVMFLGSSAPSSAALPYAAAMAGAVSSVPENDAEILRSGPWYIAPDALLGGRQIRALLPGEEGFSLVIEGVGPVSCSLTERESRLCLIPRADTSVSLPGSLPLRLTHPDGRTAIELADPFLPADAAPTVLYAAGEP